MTPTARRIIPFLLLLLLAVTANAATPARQYYCATYAKGHAECTHDRTAVAPEDAPLARVQDDGNYSITYVAEPEGMDFWRYPANLAGDCEDYAIWKKQRLIEAGVPEAAMGIVGLRQREGDHAVLAVRTPDGVMVLDNRRHRVYPWSELDGDVVMVPGNVREGL